MEVEVHNSPHDVASVAVQTLQEAARELSARLTLNPGSIRLAPQEAGTTLLHAHMCHRLQCAPTFPTHLSRCTKGSCGAAAKSMS
jgi:hypothetical protein